MTEPIRVVELFAGYGSQALALKRLGIPFTSTICEIDKDAIAAYNAIHGETFNLGDITKVEHLPPCDLLTNSSPCTSISHAGKREGMKEGSGTESALIWEVKRLLEDAKKRDQLPKFIVGENVAAQRDKNNIEDYRAWLDFLQSIGYTTTSSVMDAKDYDVPQSRKRLFTVSVLGNESFIFPKGEPTKRILRDVLETDVDESYYLSYDKIKAYERHRIRQEENGRGYGWNPQNINDPLPSRTVTSRPDRQISTIIIESGSIEQYRKEHESKIIIAGDLNKPNYLDRMNRVYSVDGIAPTMVCKSSGGMQPKIEIDCIEYPSANKRGFIKAHRFDGLVMDVRETSRGTVQKQSSPTLTTSKGCNVGVIDNNLRIRYITERESFRLMDVPEQDIDKILSVVTAKTSRYKLAGNSIVVSCLTALFRSLLIDRTFKIQTKLECF